MAKRRGRSKRNWSEAAFVASTLLFIMLAVGCGTSDQKGAPAPAPAKAPESTPKPAAQAELKTVEPKVDTNAPAVGTFKLYSVEAWQKEQAKKTNSVPAKSTAKPTNDTVRAEYVTPSMRPVILKPQIAPKTLIAGIVPSNGVASVPQPVKPEVKPVKPAKPEKPVAKASASVLERTAEALVYTRGKVWNIHWSSDPDFHGLGLYANLPRDEVIGAQFVKFLGTKGPLTRDLLVAGYVHAQWGTADRNWQFYLTQDPPARILGARYLLGVLCELDRQNHGELLKVTTGELFKLIDERPLLTSYTDERNLCPAP